MYTNATTAVEASAGVSAQTVVKAGPLRNQAARPSTPNRQRTRLTAFIRK